MSYTKIDNRIFEDENLKHTEFRVLAYLIRNHNTSMGYSFPTREQIIKSCKMNKDTLNSVLKSLEEKGYITRKNNPSKAGRNVIYFIHKYLVVIDKEVEEIQDEIKVKENKEVEDEIDELVRKYYAGEIIIDKSEDEDLRQKVETVESTVGRKINQGFKNILSKLTWDEIIEIDMSLAGKTVNESYYLGAIHRVRPDLKCII